MANTQQQIQQYRRWLITARDVTKDANNQMAAKVLTQCIDKLNELCPEQQSPSPEEYQRMAEMIEIINEEAERRK